MQGNTKIPILKVLDPGPMTTVQDLGRIGYQALGVPVSGALDQISAMLANWLVGNWAGEALLEATFMGPKLEAMEDLWISVTGARAIITLNGREIEGSQPIRVKPGDILWIKRALKGLRVYVAVRGGIAVPRVMGSYSTYVQARLGGIQGRALIKGDTLMAKQNNKDWAGPKEMYFPYDLVSDFEPELTLRAIPGPQDYHFRNSIELFYSSTFKVSSKADRMGYRLEGPLIPKDLDAPQSIISEPSMPGSIQVPPDGNPIILLVEQTVGGYSKIATLIWQDVSRIAQARPGDEVRFERIELTKAHHLYKETWKRLNDLRERLGAPSHRPR